MIQCPHNGVRSESQLCRIESRIESCMKNHRRLHTINFHSKIHETYVKKKSTSDSPVSCAFLPHRRCHTGPRTANLKAHRYTRSDAQIWKLENSAKRLFSEAVLAKSTTYTVKQRYQIFWQKSDYPEKKSKKILRRNSQRTPKNVPPVQRVLPKTVERNAWRGEEINSQKYHLRS